MSDEETVIASYPNAVAKENTEVSQLGQSAPYQAGYWGIYSGPGLGADEIGRGDTEDEAWADAAQRLMAISGDDEVVLED